MVGVGAVITYFAYQLPDVDDLAAFSRRPSIELRDSDGRVFATYGDHVGDVVRPESAPPHLVDAVLAIEDRRFYSHHGVDPLGLIRALYLNWQAGKLVAGGSTITQQVAKNVFLTNERTLARKVQEALLALWLEHRFTKDEILTIYLNRVYLGAGAYGMDAAARRYFGRRARDLSLYEAAILAGMLKAPSRLNPLADKEAAHERAKVVLGAMVEVGAITPETSAAALRDRDLGRGGPGGEGGARYFADWITDELDSLVAYRDRDLIVQTTLDRRVQDAAEQALSTGLSAADPAARIGQGALVAMRDDGRVLAVVGGRDYRTSPFNRATQARRQPGSVFKPVVYLAALEAGWQPDDHVLDAPITIRGWSPDNFLGRHRGEISLSRALAESVNTAAVRLSEQVGRANVVRMARRLGITAPLAAVPSIALGVAEVTVMEMTGAFATIANGGRGAWPYGIVEIRDRRGAVLYSRAGGGPGQTVSARATQALRRMMEGVVAWGTGKRAKLDRPAAGKTGTSQSFRDAWFIGFADSLVAGVWVGNDDGTPMRKVTGGTVPAEIWAAFMKSALGPPRPDPAPVAEASAPAVVPSVPRPGSSPAATVLSDSGADPIGALLGALPIDR